MNTHYLYCQIPKPSSKENNIEIPCYFMIDNDDKSIRYSNIHLTPYYTTVDVENPFEIIIDNNGNNIQYYTLDEYEPRIYRILD